MSELWDDYVEFLSMQVPKEDGEDEYLLALELHEIIEYHKYLKSEDYLKKSDFYFYLLNKNRTRLIEKML